MNQVALHVRHTFSIFEPGSFKVKTFEKRERRQKEASLSPRKFYIRALER
jgi:hypothetical protein